MTLGAQRVLERYKGKTATGYLARREQTVKWQNEQQAAERILSQFKEGTKVLDVPIGTGRFIPMYARYGHHVTGLDVSWDMMNQAKDACLDTGFRNFSLAHGDILQLPLQSEWTYDLAVCVRLLNHFKLEESQQALKYLFSVAPNVMISLRQSASGQSELKNRGKSFHHHLSALLPPRLNVSVSDIPLDTHGNSYHMMLLHVD